MDEMRSWLLEKLNKIDKHLAGLAKRRREKIQTNESGDQRGEIPKYTKVIQKIVREYFKNPIFH